MDFFCGSKKDSEMEKNDELMFAEEINILKLKHKGGMKSDIESVKEFDFPQGGW